MMRTSLLKIALVLFSVSPVLSQDVYFLKDYQYFRPMLANIRTSQNHARFYCNDEVEFSNSTKSGRHLFFDPSFGEYFALIGYNFENIDVASATPLRISGATFFIDGSAHLLLDWDTVSSDVINTDYRIGGGIDIRVPKIKWLSLRYRFFHESTHIGDEYTLFASRQEGFRRYNVSYEASELYVSADRYFQADTTLTGPSLHKDPISYLRGYWGVRFLNKDEFSGFTGEFDPSEPIRLTNKREFQLGGEVYVRGWPSPDERPQATFLSKLFAFQNFVIAIDLSRHDRYTVDSSDRSWSTNIVFGFVYGKSFGLTSERTVRWQLSYYNGVNPHGQFRQEKLKYVAVDYIIDF